MTRTLRSVDWCTLFAHSEKQIMPRIQFRIKEEYKSMFFFNFFTFSLKINNKFLYNLVKKEYRLFTKVQAPEFSDKENIESESREDCAATCSNKLACVGFYYASSKCYHYKNSPTSTKMKYFFLKKQPIYAANFFF